MLRQYFSSCQGIYRRGCQVGRVVGKVRHDGDGVFSDNIVHGEVQGLYQRGAGLSDRGWNYRVDRGWGSHHLHVIGQSRFHHLSLRQLRQGRGILHSQSHAGLPDIGHGRGNRQDGEVECSFGQRITSQSSMEGAGAEPSILFHCLGGHGIGLSSEGGQIGSPARVLEGRLGDALIAKDPQSVLSILLLADGAAHPGLVLLQRAEQRRAGHVLDATVGAGGIRPIVVILVEWVVHFFEQLLEFLGEGSVELLALLVFLFRIELERKIDANVTKSEY